MTAKEYNRHAARLRAYRRALHRFLDELNPDKAAAILPRLKMAEITENEMYNQMKNNIL